MIRYHILRYGKRGQDSSVGIATRYGLDGPGIEYRLGARFSAPVQTGRAAHPASCTTVTGSFPGVKRPERGADHPPPSRAEFEWRVELYLHSTSGPLWTALGWPLPLPLPLHLHLRYDMIFIYCNWFPTRWQWSVNLYKHSKETEGKEKQYTKQHRTHKNENKHRKNNNRVYTTCVISIGGGGAAAQQQPHRCAWGVEVAFVYCSGNSLPYWQTLRWWSNP